MRRWNVRCGNNEKERKGEIAVDSFRRSEVLEQCNGSRARKSANPGWPEKPGFARQKFRHGGVGEYLARGQTSKHTSRPPTRTARAAYQHQQQAKIPMEQPMTGMTCTRCRTEDPSPLRLRLSFLPHVLPPPPPSLFNPWSPSDRLSSSREVQA